MAQRIATAEKGLEAGIGKLAESLLSSGAVQSVFISQYDEKGEGVYGTLKSDVNGDFSPAPLAPYLNGNKGREAGMAVRKNAGARTAVFLRPCEARAVIELSKLNQADRNSMLLITYDCPGTLSIDDYKRFRKEQAETGASVDAFYREFSEGKRMDGYSVRDCCTYCDSLAHEKSDVKIMFVGAGEGEAVVEAVTDEGRKALEQIGLDETTGADGKIRESFLEKQRNALKELEERWAAEITSIEDFLSLLTHCRRCYNCRAECPICYCRECVFQTATFDTPAETFEKRAGQFGTIKMPPDTLVFHLTRMNHMAAACVSCGQCTEACPQGIPVGRAFTAIGKKVQGLFEYSAGADPEDELPLTVYKEDELEPR